MNAELTFSFLNVLDFIHSIQLIVPIQLCGNCYCQCGFRERGKHRSWLESVTALGLNHCNWLFVHAAHWKQAVAGDADLVFLEGRW